MATEVQIYQDGTIVEADISTGAITNSKIADNAVTTGKIDNGSVTTGKIDNGAVTTDKIADGAVTIDKTNFGPAALFPIGGIIMWSGTIATIPTGWAICDGNNQTPDLRNRFIVGAHSGVGIGTIATTGPGFNAITGALNSNYTPGNTGGSVGVALTIGEMPSHNHVDNTAGPSRPTSSGGGRDGAQGFTTLTGNTGGDQFHENRPPYYALAFIMRVS